MFGEMDNRRSSCNSCAGNTHIPDIRSSRTDRRDNRSRPRLRRSRLKPERQLVLPEQDSARLLPMEVKEVFSYILLCLNFPLFVCLQRDRCSWHGAQGAYENRASSLFI